MSKKIISLMLAVVMSAALAYCGNGVTGSVDLWGCAAVSYVTTLWKCEYDPFAIGYPMLNVFNYMKDTWEEGSAIMGILNIKTVSDLCKKAKEQLSDSLKEKIEDIVENGLWFDALMKDDSENGGASGYCPPEPSLDDVPGANQIISVEMVSIDPDISKQRGAFFIKGGEFKWKVVYE